MSDLSTLKTAAAVLTGVSADLREATAAITVPRVTRRSIRNTGREFEEGFRCDANPALAEKAAQECCDRMDFMRSPSVRRVSECEFSVHYWGLD